MGSCGSTSRRPRETMDAECRDGAREVSCREMYDQQARIAIRPRWARSYDFSAVSQNRPTRRQSSIASIPSSASSAMRSRMCWIISGGGRFQPVISSMTRSGAVVR